MSENEEWRPVPGYEGLYEVSSIGRLKRLGRWKTHWRGGQRWCPDLIVNIPVIRGYVYARLWRDGELLQTGLHRVVASAFLRRDKTDSQVNHINGNKLDNRAENLEWCTCSENLTHAALVLGRNVGESCKLSKINEDTVRRMRRMHAEGMTVPVISRSTGISKTQVRRIVMRESWRHVA